MPFNPVKPFEETASTGFTPNKPFKEMGGVARMVYPDEPDLTQEMYSSGFAPGAATEPSIISQEPIPVEKYRPTEPQEPLDMEMAAREFQSGMSYGAGAVPFVGEQIKGFLEGKYSPYGDTQPTEAERGQVETYFANRPMEKLIAGGMGTFANPLFVALGGVAGIAGKLPRLMTPGAIKTGIRASGMEVPQALRLVRRMWNRDPASFGKFVREFLGAGGRVATLGTAMYHMELAETGDEDRAQQVAGNMVKLGTILESGLGLARLGAYSKEIGGLIPFSGYVQRTAEQKPELLKARGMLKRHEGELVPMEKVSEYIGPERLEEAYSVGREPGILRQAAKGEMEAQVGRAERQAEKIEGFGEQRIERMGREVEAGTEAEVAGAERAFGRLGRSAEEKAAEARSRVMVEFDKKIQQIESETKELAGKGEMAAGELASKRVMRVRKRMKNLVDRDIKETFGPKQQEMIQEIGDVPVKTDAIVKKLEEVLAKPTVRPEVKAKAEQYLQLFRSESGAEPFREFERRATFNQRKAWEGFVNKLRAEATPENVVPLSKFLEGRSAVTWSEVDSAIPNFSRYVRGEASKTLKELARTNPGVRPLVELNEAYASSLDRLEPFVDQLKPWQTDRAVESIKPWPVSERAGELKNIEGLTDAALKRLGRRLGVDNKFARTFKQIMDDVRLTAKQRGEILEESLSTGKPLADLYKASKKEAVEAIDVAAGKRREVLAARKEKAVKGIEKRGEVRKASVEVVSEKIRNKAKEKADEVRMLGSEAARDRYESTIRGINRKYKGVPETVEQWDDLLLRGSMNDLEQAGIKRFIDKTVNGKPNKDFNQAIHDAFTQAQNLKQANELGSLFSALIGKPLARGISFGPKVTMKRILQSVLMERVQGAAVLKYDWMERWVKAASKAQIHKNPVWTKYMYGVWPMGMAPRAAVIQIWNQPKKREEFVGRLIELGEE